jgi:hypothetical protein
MAKRTKARAEQWEDMDAEFHGGPFDGTRITLHVIPHGDREGFVVQEQSYRLVRRPVRASQVER